MFFNQFGLKSRNVNIVGFVDLVLGLIFFVPILALYLEQELFSVTNVAFIFAIQTVTAALLEIPTGAITDLFGRKNSYIIAQLLFLIAIIPLYLGGHMSMFILWAVISAAGMALSSGTSSALIYDTLKEEGKEKHYKKIMSIFYSIWPFGAIIGSIAGGYFATISLSLPIILSTIPFFISITISLFLVEPKYQKEDHKNIFKQMKNSVKVITHTKQLMLILIASLIFFAFGETAHALKPIFLDFKNIPIHYFGIFFAFVFGFSSLGHYLSYHVAKKIGDKQTLLLSAILFPFFLFLATLTEGFYSMTFLVLTSIPFGLRNPVAEHLINIEIESSKRATILSINNLGISFGMAIGGPLLGYFADLWSIEVAYQIAALLMTTGAVFTLFVKNKA